MVLCAGGMCSSLLLLRTLQKWQFSSLVSLYLSSKIFPNCCMHAVIFSPLEFLCTVLLEKMLVQVQALQSPRSQLVSVSFPRSLSPYLMTSWATNKLWIILVLMTNLKKKKLIDFIFSTVLVSQENWTGFHIHTSPPCHHLRASIPLPWTLLCTCVLHLLQLLHIIIY